MLKIFSELSLYPYYVKIFYFFVSSVLLQVGEEEQGTTQPKEDEFCYQEK